MFTDLAPIFDLRFNPYAFLSLTAIIINIVVLIVVNTRGAKNETNRWFSLVLIAIILWAFSEFMDRSSANEIASLFWSYIGRPGWVFIPVLLFTFALHFVGKGELMRSKLAQFAVFGPAFLWLFFAWNTNFVSNNNLSDIRESFYGWDISPVGQYFDLFIVWLEAFLITAVVILSRFYFKTKDPIIKKQALYTIIAFVIPIIGGSITDAILPILEIEVIPIAVLFTSALSITVALGIVRYSLFTISPQLTAGSIIDTMSEALIVAGPYHTIEQVNKATLDLLGYKEKDLIGKEIKMILPDLETWDNFLKKVLIPLRKRKLVSGFEVDFRTSDGKRIPVSFSAKSLTDRGRLVAVIGLARDIRETRKLINRLTAERNKMSVTVSGIADGVFAVDDQGKIVLFNLAMAKMLDVVQDDVIGKYSDEIIKMVDEEEEKLSIINLLPKETVFEDKIVTIKKNVRITRKDGGIVFVDITSSTIAENEDINLGAIVTLHDVSKEHELEEMKLDFVSMAAHELRTPLTSIRGYLSVLLEELKGKVDNEKISFIQKAFISSTQLATLVENLLSVSRIERGRMKVEKTMVDWDELVNETIVNFKDQAIQKEVKLSYKKLSSKLPKIYIDRFRMSEVISNLVGNAVNYTDPGGLVEVSVETKDKELITHVKDTGQGIPEEALPKLFTKFFRVSGVLEQGSKGTGLGLYISKAIVEMHKGRIWVKSTLGKGSTFNFAVPLAKFKGESLEDSYVGKNKSSLGINKGGMPKKIFVKKGKKMV